ncbi:MAG TPA: hypothetical protein VGG04_03700 [Candidatus Sulfotelmatobacter sp.]|jgi:hypothetical protein
MRVIYSGLMRLYPAQYREQFGEEMAAVFEDLTSEHGAEKFLSRCAFFGREITGLMIGAARERMRVLFGDDLGLSLSTRRFFMRNEFRFPRTTAVLMTIILAGVAMAIKMGEDIAGSLPHDGGQVGPIHPVHPTLLGAIPIILVSFYAMGLACWAILFALRKSGFHRLANMSGERD